MSVVRVEHVYKDYLLGEQTVPALKDITLAIEPGVFLAIAGPSGSGKTTLLNLIGCIDTPTRGKIYINDQDVSGKTPDQLADLRARTIGFIFQTFNLLPVLTAAENVEYPLLQRPDIDKAGRRKRVDHFLDIVGLTPYAHHRPNQLSGGQRQRVAIARALAIRPVDRAGRRADRQSRPRHRQGNSAVDEVDQPQARHDVHLLDARPPRDGDGRSPGAGRGWRDFEACRCAPTASGNRSPSGGARWTRPSHPQHPRSRRHHEGEPRAHWARSPVDRRGIRPGPQGRPQ